MDDTLPIPDYLRGALRKRLAFERLRKAAQALLDENAEVAKASYREPGSPWSDDMWRRADEENWRLCREVRLSLKEIDASQSTPDPTP